MSFDFDLESLSDLYEECLRNCKLPALSYAILVLTPRSCAHQSQADHLLATRRWPLIIVLEGGWDTTFVMVRTTVVTYWFLHGSQYC